MTISSVIGRTIVVFTIPKSNQRFEAVAVGVVVGESDQTSGGGQSFAMFLFKGTSPHDKREDARGQEGYPTGGSQISKKTKDLSFGLLIL